MTHNIQPKAQVAKQFSVLVRNIKVKIGRLKNRVVKQYHSVIRYILKKVNKHLQKKISEYEIQAHDSLNSRQLSKSENVIIHQADENNNRISNADVEFDLSGYDEFCEQVRIKFTNEFCRFKKMQLEVAKEFIPDSGPESLSLYIEEQLSALSQNTVEDPLGKDSIKALKHHLKTILRTFQKEGVSVSVIGFKRAMVKKFGGESWDTITNRFLLGTDEKKRKITQKCIPACKIGRDLLSQFNSGLDVFPSAYHDKGVIAHAIKDKNHATNMFISQLNIDGDKELTIVRHGINSAYGLRDATARNIAAMNRAKEVITAALASKQELFGKALRGEVVQLSVTSSSLVTPDHFRRVLKPKGDEKRMLRDQYNAFEELRKQSPVTLVVKDSNNQDKEIKIDLKLVSFNFGVNTFAVGENLNKLGGWSGSDRINRRGIKELIGYPASTSSTPGGMVGEWLEQNNDDKNAPVVKELAWQIKEIFNSNAHHTLQGGAYKLPARIIVLTSLIGGVPCTNCKSGKDRTGMSVAAAEALFTYIQLNHSVPDWKSVDLKEAGFLKELCLRGGHHEIQRRNVGVGGFKIQPEILTNYGMNDTDIALVRGLSDISFG
ncbi:inositol phosphate phosphatase SopB [Endozoicomonas sp.]|uniref:inositol phosphate phosphatase SopB n=1 Tax=Endozoicomonas sp. TaxID=1892382 RepID=UPI002887D2FA|nr:inositol phosphate phosphatase SopB [Endozoicomonas sp.]